MTAPTPRETADHAELARLAEAAVACAKPDEEPWFEEWQFPHLERAEREFIAVANPSRVLALLSEIAALRGDRDRIAGESIWWKGVIGDASHQPSGEVPSIKHMHPAMVKPIYDAHKGTAVADVIAGLIFSLSITQNREQFLVQHANDRATQAERQRDELRKAAETAANLFKLCTEPTMFENVSTLNLFAQMAEWLVRSRPLIANQGVE